MKPPAKRHYLSDASVEAVGGYCVEINGCWRYDLPERMTADLKRKVDRREASSITINLLEVLGVVVTAWVMLELVGDKLTCDGDPVSMRDDNVAAVSWGEPMKVARVHDLCAGGRGRHIVGICRSREDRVFNMYQV